MLQTNETVLQNFDLGSCLYLCSSIKLLHIYGLLHGMGCSNHNSNNSLWLWHIILHQLRFTVPM